MRSRGRARPAGIAAMFEERVGPCVVFGGGRLLFDFHLARVQQDARSGVLS
jgi:hypothetical protein